MGCARKKGDWGRSMEVGMGMEMEYRGNKRSGKDQQGGIGDGIDREFKEEEQELVYMEEWG